MSIVVLALGIIVGCQPAQPPNVLLITIDTLRPDYMSRAGYDRPTTPGLDEIFERGVSFERAVSPIARTTPALASLLTGAYPHTTKLRTLYGTLSADVETLAEVLSREEFQTLAVVANNVLKPERELNRGFDTYRLDNDAVFAADTTAAALGALAKLDPERPVFAWVHYIDPHVPYHPNPARVHEFDPGYRGPYEESFGYQPRSGEPIRMYRPFPDDLPKAKATHRNPLSARVNEHIRRLYAADIHRVDKAVAKLVDDALEFLGNETIIVVTSDHGESLGEHDFYFDHGDYVYNASTRVPLVIILPEEDPSTRGTTCNSWVSLVDVTPTLIELLELNPSLEVTSQFEGRSLVPCLQGDDLDPLPVYSESGRSYYPKLVRKRVRFDLAGRLRSVTHDRWKLVHNPFQTPELQWELYDMVEDPAETQNLYREDHPAFPVLRGRLENWMMLDAPHDRAGELSPEDRDALRALGYME